MYVCMYVYMYAKEFVSENKSRLLDNRN
jgi:hypothetical protein